MSHFIVHNNKNYQVFDNHTDILFYAPLKMVTLIDYAFAYEDIYNFIADNKNITKIVRYSTPSDNGIDICIRIVEPVSIADILELNEYINWNLGWFCCYCEFGYNDNSYSGEIDMNLVIEHFDDIYGLMFQYTMPYNENLDLPDKVYHCCPKHLTAEILKNGLIPHDNKKWCYDWERTYFFFDKSWALYLIETYPQVLNSFFDYDALEFDLLEIETNINQFKKDIHYDNACYTTQTIKNIKLLHDHYTGRI